MDRVVSYDYPIDNKEEMKMEDIRVNSSWNQETEVSVIKVPFGNMRMRVHLDLSPDDPIYIDKVMDYTAKQARELAAALIKAAEYVEAEVDE